MYNKKICVIGGGYWGSNHIKTLSKLNCLGGIVESNFEVLQKYKKKFSGLMLHDNVEEAIKNSSYSGFVVSTPAQTHYEIAKKVILSGNHVLVEKPLTLNIEDAEKLVHLSKKCKVNLMVGHLLLFHPAINKIKEFIDSGKIGKLQYMYSNRLNLGQIRAEENVFWSFAPHDISLFQYFNDCYPINIIAHGSTFLQKGVHDSTITQLAYPNGVKGHIFVNWLHPFKEHRIVIIGSKGMLTYEDSSLEKHLKYYNKKFNLNEKVPTKIDGPIEYVNYDKKMPLEQELIYFLKNCDGSKIKHANHEHALEVVKILTDAGQQIEEK